MKLTEKEAENRFGKDAIDMKKGGNLLSALKAAREAKEMTQEQTAHACGMTLNNYARIERGDTGTTVHTLQKIADTLDLRLVLTVK